jgi:hypothetical protein
MVLHLIQAKVRGGVIVTEGEPLPEGSAVTVVFDDEDVFEPLTEEEIRELDRRSREISRGNYVTPEQLFAGLARIRAARDSDRRKRAAGDRRRRRVVGGASSVRKGRRGKRAR